MTLPTSLTLLRIGLIPVFVGAFYLPGTWSNVLSAGIFTLAALTDWLDGFLARRLDQASAFGAFLDPVADKLMVSVALVLLVEADPHPWVAIPAAVIIGREIAVSALREWMAAIGQRQRVAVVMLGKLKTAFQLVAIIAMLYRAPLGDFPSYELGLGLLYAAAVLTLWSMLGYLRAALPHIDGAEAPPQAGPETESETESETGSGDAASNGVGSGVRCSEKSRAIAGSPVRREP